MDITTRHRGRQTLQRVTRPSGREAAACRKASPHRHTPRLSPRGHCLHLPHRLGQRASPPRAGFPSLPGAHPCGALRGAGGSGAGDRGPAMSLARSTPPPKPACCAQARCLMSLVDHQACPRADQRPVSLVGESASHS